MLNWLKKIVSDTAEEVWFNVSFLSCETSHSSRPQPQSHALGLEKLTRPNPNIMNHNNKLPHK